VRRKWPSTSAHSVHGVSLRLEGMHCGWRRQRQKSFSSWYRSTWYELAFRAWPRRRARGRGLRAKVAVLYSAWRPLRRRFGALVADGRAFSSTTPYCTVAFTKSKSALPRPPTLDRQPPDYLPQCLPRTPKKPGADSRPSSHDGPRDSEEQAEVARQRAHLVASQASS
jgi:hypothetical protein